MRTVLVTDDTYLMLVDGKVVPVDLAPVMRRHRAAHVKARADLIAQAASMLGDEAFTLEESYEAAEAAMPPGMVNAAGHIAVTLREVELGGER
jgi:hypothetical protein